MRLKDKVAIVTGGGKGIGKAIVLAFASEGAAVVICGRGLQQLTETEEEVRVRGGRALAVQTDVADEDHVARMVKRCVDEFGQIDVLVNNSGVTGPTSTVADMDLAAWNQTLATNLTGAMLCSREVLRHMIPRREGAVVNIGSEGGRGGDGRAGFIRRSAYCCSKMGIIGLTETMAVEVGEFGIRVNAVSPAGVRGDRIDGLFEARARALGISLDEMIGRVLVNYSLGRMADESEIASAVLFLASDEASAITGQVLAVNCGHHIIH